MAPAPTITTEEGNSRSSRAWRLVITSSPVHGQGRYAIGASARCQDHVLGPNHPAFGRHLDGVGVPQTGLSLYVLHVILSQEMGNSPDAAAHYTAAAVHSLGVIHLEVIEMEAELLGPS